MEYLAIDPGQHIGWCLFNEEGYPYDVGTHEGIPAMEDWLEELPKVDRTVVVEDYKIFKHKALQQSGTRVVAAKCIGSVESWARRRKHQLVLQPASILTIAELWSGTKMPSNHSKSHHVSAFLHGYYYLVKKDVIKLK